MGQLVSFHSLYFFFLFLVLDFGGCHGFGRGGVYLEADSKERTIALQENLSKASFSHIGGKVKTR